MSATTVHTTARYTDEGALSLHGPTEADSTLLGHIDAGGLAWVPRAAYLIAEAGYTVIDNDWDTTDNLAAFAMIAPMPDLPDLNLFVEPDEQQIAEWVRISLASLVADIRSGQVAASIATYDDLYNYVEASDYTVNNAAVPFGSENVLATHDDPDGHRLHIAVEDAVEQAILTARAAASDDDDFVARLAEAASTPASRFLRKVADLVEGDEFSTDGGATWHTTCAVLFGNVAVYATGRRDAAAPTLRLDVERDADVLVRAPRTASVESEATA